MTGNYFKEARLGAGLSQRALAERAGISHKAVQYWEAKENLDPHGYAVNRMAQALGLANLSDHYARPRHGVLSTEELNEFVDAQFTGSLQRLLKRVVNRRVACGAKTRKGTPCRAKSEPGRRRCRLHGGLSTGPKTEEGKERIRQAQSKRWKQERVREKQTGAAD